MRKAWALALFMVWGFAAKTQTADGIIDKYLEAIGAENYQQLKNMQMQMSVDMNGMSITGTTTQSSPNKVKVELSLNGNEVVQAYDGETAWVFNPAIGFFSPQKLNGPQKEAMKKDFLDPFIDYKNRGSQVSFEGEKEYEGKSYWVIKRKDKLGIVSLNFFDQDSGLLIIQKASTDGREAETHFSDYQKQGEILVAMKLVIKLEGQVFQSMTISDVKVNLDLPEDFFTFPEN